MKETRPISLVACGIFKEEFAALGEELRKRFSPTFLDSMLHMDPEELDRRLAGALPAPGTAAVILYGDCSPHMREAADEPGRSRTEGINCCEICLGRDRYRQLRKAGAFFLMNEWARRWEEVFKKELGFDNPALARAYMSETMSEVVYLDCGSAPVPETTLSDAAAYLGLPSRVEACGLGHLEAALRRELEKAKEFDEGIRRAKPYDEAAFTMMFADLVERLLSLSDKPSGSSDFMAEELRALVGARTVMVFLCSPKSGDDKHLLASVFPERRRLAAADARIEEILRLSRAYTHGRLIRRGDGTRESELLADLGIDLSILVPLSSGSRREGAILMLDLLDRENVDKAMVPLERLSSILALVLRNAYLYAHLEEEVADRTRRLEERSRELERSLAEKETLLKEVHHRVKNNLQIVISLLYLKSSVTKDDETREALEDSQTRIHAMALVHEELYKSADLEKVDLADYVPRLVSSIMDPVCPGVRRIFEVESIRLVPGLAIPCGLIVSELVMNCVKHAFAARGAGTLRLGIAREGDDAVIELEDDGPGIPEETRMGFLEPAFCGDRADRSIGLTISTTLAEQLHGRLELRNSAGGGSRGARIALRFPLPQGTMSG